MHADIAEFTRRRLAALTAADVTPGELDPDVDLVRSYGLTSLNKVVLLTSVCRRAGVDLTLLSDDDLAQMLTLREIIDTIARYVPEGGNA
ncbi:acyl carrier protein [Nocardia uniformis]|uniref:Acyl carrier protein n=1 Tax=Nocardia uniformis TaxID=53432 RepID=A0A849BNT4_9NOCA|nr:phosphopantetheine-binding protein [Nocardia uniformis]NNH68372.1 acyl carrier protein [Nocardia uniformis]